LIDKENHKLVLAADCRVNHSAESHAECKIVEEPGCTVVIAGLYREPSTGFSLRKLVRAACRYPGDLREKAEAFVRLSRKPYQAAADQTRETDPIDFRETMENRPTEVIFAGLRNGCLSLFVRGFVSDARGKITTERFESSDGRSGSIGYFLGLNHHIREYVNRGGEWGRLGYTQAARQFVEIEVRANPEFAGLPISEMEIDAGGAVHWISRGACNTQDAD
jgi:hypothetical protein